MWNLSLGLLSVFLLIWPPQSYAANFTFSYGPPTQCDDFEVSWKGGVPPFQLALVPSYGTPRYYSIPDSNFSNKQGTFATPLILPADRRFIAVMSDSSGFASGGITPVLTIGASVGNKNCNITEAHPDFYYQTNSALAQCRTYVFDGYAVPGNQAVQPVVITGLVPGGSSFVLNPPRGPSYTWIADVPSGTTVTFIMVDANGRQGGSTEFTPVLISDEASCLDASSPASVTNAPSATSSAPPTKTDGGGKSSTSQPSSTSPPDTDPEKSSNAGTVAATIVGTLVAMLVVGSLIWFYLRRRNRGTGPLRRTSVFGRPFRKHEVDLMRSDSNLPPPATLNPYPLYTTEGSTPNSSANLLHGRPIDTAAAAAYPGSASAYSPNTASASQYPQSATAPPGSQYGRASTYGDTSAYGRASAYGGVAGALPEGSVASWDQSVTSSAAARKAQQAGVSTYQPSARYILHTDIEDDLPPPPEEEVIELPPQYSERRVPAASIASGSGQGMPPSPGGLPYSDGYSRPS